MSVRSQVAIARRLAVAGGRKWLILRLVILLALGAFALALAQTAGQSQAPAKPADDGSPVAARKLSRMRMFTQADREAAAKRAAARRANLEKAGQLKPQTATPSCAAPFGTPCGPVDYFGTIPNYALSKLPAVTITSAPGVVPVTYAVTAGTGIQKFVDRLPGVGPANANAMGNFIPVAVPISPHPAGVPNDVPNGSDYYEIGLVDYLHQFHTNLPATTNVRGYRDLNPAATNPVANAGFGADNNAHYLGPIILAQRDKPVRIKFTNQIVPNTPFFVPVDTSIMGAGMGPDGTPYSNNRATLHLHGGSTPWISDGTPHQWTVPQPQGALTELTNFKKGVSTQDVPDMPASGDGQMTFFWTNQQSGRLMFYHDHAFGITRLNVYAGEAAGYLLHDPILDAQIGVSIPDNAGVDLTSTTTLPRTTVYQGRMLTGGLYTFGIPLVIQDKTFVPPAAQLAAQDPTWNWGSEGNLWFPHVYMTNQSPSNPDNSGANPMGRWDLGAWFWPPMSPADLLHLPITCGTPGSNTVVTAGYDPLTAQCPATPNPSLVPEAFMDTPVINGQAYPTLTLPVGTYRFQILNAANDRMMNLSLFYAADKTDQNIVCKTGYTGVNSLNVPYTYAGGNSPNCTEVKMVPSHPHPLIMPVTATNPPPEVPADLDDTVPACAVSATQPDVIVNSNFLITANIPTVAGTGALDYNPATGLPGLVRPCWPSSWPTDGRDGGVPDPTTAGPPWVQIGTEGGVLPAPVVIPATPIGYNYNRRDIVVLNVQEHALFLGPAERADVIVDLSLVPPGSTLMLYNDAPAPVPGFDPRLDYYTGAPDYSSTGGAPTIQPGYGPNIRTLMQIQVVAGTATNYMTAASGLSLATLKANLPGIFAATQPPIIVPETTYPAAAIGGTPAKDSYTRIQNTSLTYTPIGGVPTTQPLLAKAIHELFDSNYGRMNSVLGTEVPLTTFTNQTTIPLSYIDPPTEILNDGQIQMWKITHNGVDTHAVHFHLFDVQVINRMGWDGAIRPPDPNELGWKETVRMNPLEDISIAIRPTKMTLPFAIGESVRMLDPTRPQFATNAQGMPGFTNIDPFTNNPINTVNDFANFGWEYVWHCHLLGHEENDMMRPLVFKVAVPNAPVLQSAVVSGATSVTLTWTYTAGVTPATTFVVQRAGAGTTFATLPAGAAIPIVGAGPYTFTDTTAALGNVYSYRVMAANVALSTASAPSNAINVAMLTTPTNLHKVVGGSNFVSMAWTDTPSTGANGFQVQRCTGTCTSAGPFTTIATLTSVATTSYTASGLSTTTGATYTFRVAATSTGGNSAYSNLLTVTRTATSY